MDEALFTVLPTDFSMEETNTSVNHTENCTDPFKFFQTEQVIFLSTLFVFITAANVCVLVAIMLSKTRKSRMNYFIMHLAFADLATAVFAMLPDIIWKVTVAWYAGNVGCKLVRFLQSMVTYASTYVLVVLSIDRFDAIARPMNFQSSGLRARILVTVAWLFAALASTPMLFLSRQIQYGCVKQCWITLEQWQWKVYVTLHALFIFFIPAVIIACCYIFISLIIWSKDSLYMKPRHVTVTRFSKTKGEQPPDLLLNGSTRKQSSLMGSSSRGLLPKARVKTVKMTLVIVLVFIVCWTPWFFYNMADVYGYIRAYSGKTGVDFFVQSLIFLNAVANPGIYCVFSSKMCVNRRQNTCCEGLIQSCCCFKTDPAPEPPSTQSEYIAIHSRYNSRRMRSLISKTEGNTHNTKEKNKLEDEEVPKHFGTSMNSAPQQILASN